MDIIPDLAMFSLAEQLMGSLWILLPMSASSKVSASSHDPIACDMQASMQVLQQVPLIRYPT